MVRTRLAVLALVAVLLAGNWGDSAVAGRLQGAWEITSVRRDGDPDPAHVGASLTFTGDTVTFRTKLVRFDGTSSSTGPPVKLDKEALRRIPRAVSDGTS